MCTDQPPQNGGNSGSNGPDPVPHEMKVVDCTDPAVKEHCSVCMHIKININNVEYSEQLCKVCKEGWVKGDRGSCYRETMQGEPCKDKMEGCEHCVQFPHRVPAFD